MKTQPADLRSQIADLQAEFQHVADQHDWVCLFIPPLGRQREFGPLVAGQLTWPSAPPSHLPGKIVDEHGRPFGPSEAMRLKRSREWGKNLDEHGPPPWVMMPKDSRLHALVDHVNTLTQKAHQLLLCVLDGDNRIPTDIQQQIREWEGQSIEYGWVRWLRYAAVIRGRSHVCENYPQVAATALQGLRDCCRSATGTVAGEAAIHEFLWPPAADPAMTKGFEGKRHDDLLRILRDKADAKLLGQQRTVILQCLGDAGCDLLIDWGGGFKFGIQLKSHHDIGEKEFAATTIRQIQDSRQHGLKKLFVLLAGDLTDNSQLHKVRDLESRVSKMNDGYVATVSPERLWTLLFQ